MVGGAIGAAKLSDDSKQRVKNNARFILPVVYCPRDGSQGKFLFFSFFPFSSSINLGKSPSLVHIHLLIIFVGKI